MRAALVSPVTTDGTLATVSTISRALTASAITTRSEMPSQWKCLQATLDTWHRHWQYSLVERWTWVRVSRFCFLVDELGVGVQPSDHRWYLWSYAVLCFGLSGVGSQSVPGTKLRSTRNTWATIGIHSKNKQKHKQILLKSHCEKAHMPSCYCHFVKSKIHLFNGIYLFPAD